MEVQGNEQPQEVTASEPAAAASSQSSSPADGAELAGDAPAYTPNFSFKVMNEQKEFDPWIREAIKNAETEKAVRELYEKAHGLEFVKNERTKFKEELSGLKPQFAEMQDAFKLLGNYRQRNDFPNLFKSLNISEDDVLKHALKIVELREMPADQRQALAAQQERDQEYYALRQENEMLSGEYNQVAVNARTQELDWTLQRPEIAQAAQSFDARVGRPGAFREEVIKRGQFYWHSSKQDLPAAHLAEELVGLMGLKQQQQGQEPAAGQPAGQQAASQPTAPKPVIPNIRGKGTSPARKLPRSLDDLKKLSKESQNQSY